MVFKGTSPAVLMFKEEEEKKDLLHRKFVQYVQEQVTELFP